MIVVIHIIGFSVLVLKKITNNLNKFTFYLFKSGVWVLCLSIQLKLFKTEDTFASKIQNEKSLFSD